jgi:phage baseplate assembly protein V
MSDFETTELDRRISNLIKFGTVQAADYVNATVRIKAGDILTDWLPWQTQRAGGNISWHAPEIGEQVVVLSPSGELNQGVVLIGLYQSLKPPAVATPNIHQIVYSDGAIVEYDRHMHHLKAVLPDGATMAVRATGGMTIIGDITLTGTLTASVDVIANGISLHNHKHGGVTAGSAQTGVPA